MLRNSLVLGGCFLTVLLAGCPSQPAGNNSGGAGGGSQVVAPPAKPAYLPAGAVLPSAESVENGTYAPLSRPLYMYVSKKAMKRPETIAFLQYYFSDESRELPTEVGYVKLPAAELEKSRETLKQAVAEASVAPASELRGDIIIDGSSTVVKLTQAVAEEFQKKNPNVRVPVGGNGTGNGFNKFCIGETDINDASRPINENEKKLCAEKGIEYVELKVCIDGLTVVVNPKATWVDGLTVADLKKIWEPDSKVKNWSDINPEFPQRPIKLYGPDTGSGTFDYFTEVINGKTKASRSEYQQSTDDNVLVQGVGADEYALGYFGFAYYVENKDKLKALAVAK